MFRKIKGWSIFLLECTFLSTFSEKELGFYLGRELDILPTRSKLFVIKKKTLAKLGPPEF